MDYLTRIKLIILTSVSAIITIISFQFTDFEAVTEGVEYGIWRGFPFGYFFTGEYIDWSVTPLPDWIGFSYWRPLAWVGDFLIYFIFIGSVFLLIDFYLKRLVKLDH